MVGDVLGLAVLELVELVNDFLGAQPSRSCEMRLFTSSVLRRGAAVHEAARVGIEDEPGADEVARAEGLLTDERLGHASTPPRRPSSSAENSVESPSWRRRPSAATARGGVPTGYHLLMKLLWTSRSGRRSRT